MSSPQSPKRPSTGRQEVWRDAALVFFVALAAGVLCLLIGIRSPLGMTSVQIVIDACTAAAVVLLAGSVSTRRAGRAAGLAYALYPWALVYATAALPETLFTALLTGAVLFVVTGALRNRVGVSAAGGVLLGLSAWCRPIALPLVVIFPAIVVRSNLSRRQPHALAVMAAALLTVTPWVFGEFSGIHASLGALFEPGDVARGAIDSSLLLIFSLVLLALAILGWWRAAPSIATRLVAAVCLYMLVVHLPLWTAHQFWLPAVPCLLVSAAMTRPSRGFGGLRAAMWRRDLAGWLQTNVAAGLVSRNGSADLAAAVSELGRRLTPILAALDGGPRTLDDATFAGQFKSGLSWIAFQEPITARDVKLRAYCDLTASLAVFNGLVAQIAVEFGTRGAVGEIAIARRLARAAGGWREAEVAAGRRLLDAGQYDDAIACARQALAAMTSCPVAQRLLMDGLRARRDAGQALTLAEQNGLMNLRGHFCPRPFEVLVSGQSPRWDAATSRSEQVMGASYLCDCAAYLPFLAGNVAEAACAHDAWNSPAAQEIRRSVLEGDYSYCSRTLCPVIAGGTVPRTDEITSPRLRRIIERGETVLDDGPIELSVGHDSSCNLACPTCRVDIVMADKAQNERLELARDRTILPLVRDRPIRLLLTSWGDPFASRHYRSILEALRAPEYAQSSILLQTNGLLLTRQTWEAMPQLAKKTVQIRVSIDAATKHTYEDVRRPGRWETIRTNLEIMGEMNRQGIFRRNLAAERQAMDGLTGALTVGTVESPCLYFCFVVQRANFREMPAFVELAERLGADAVAFQRYQSFGHEGAPAYREKDVASLAHPDHAELLEMLCDPCLRRPIVHQPLLTLSTGPVSS